MMVLYSEALNLHLKISRLKLPICPETFFKLVDQWESMLNDDDNKSEKVFETLFESQNYEFYETQTFMGKNTISNQPVQFWLSMNMWQGQTRTGMVGQVSIPVPDTLIVDWT